jgi:tetratricopeptide (TPR) repeat protein
MPQRNNLSITHYMKNIHFLIVLGLFLGFASCKTQKQPVARGLVPPESIREVSQIEQLESTARLIEAGKQKMLGNYANAILLYAEASKIDPRNSAALYELAKLHAQQGFAKDAEVFALQAVWLDPDNKYFGMLLADTYFMQKKNDLGHEVQQKLAKKNPTDLNIQISLLSTLVYLEKYDEAIRQFEYIEYISGFNNELSLQKQKILLEMDQPDLAIEEAKRLISYFPQEPVYLELLAELYTETGQDDKAYQLYRQMLALQPDNPMAYLLLADYYRNNQQEEKSFEHLLKAFESPLLEIDGKSRIMASYYYLSGEDSLYRPQAYKLCGIMLEIHPEEAQAHAIYGDFLFRDEKLEEAWEAYFTAATLDPSDLAYWQQVLSIETRLMDYQSLLNTSNKALEYFFEQPVLYLFNGLANQQLKNYPQALSAFKYGIDLTGDQVDLKGQFLVLIADTYYKMGEHENSFSHYEQALSVDPDNSYVLNNYSYYLSLLNINLDKALMMSARSLELDPDNASFQDTYGWIKYKMGDYQQAYDWIKKALDNSEEPRTEVLEHYGDVLYKLGRTEDALCYWKKALDVRDQDDENGSEFLEKKVMEGKLFE